MMRSSFHEEITMPRKVFVHPVNKTIRVRPNSESAATGETLIGTSDHVDVAANADDSVGNNVSHVLYHHIQELMIKAGRFDYAAYRIINVVPITGVNAGNDFSLAVAATRQLAPVVLPTNTTEPQAVTYASSVPAKATVSVGGLVTGVAAGTTVITVTNTSSGLIDMITVTVTA
jgi:uncharacterized protein YjdB